MRLVAVSPGHYVSTGAAFPFAASWQLGLAFQLPSDRTVTASVSVTVT